MGCGCSARGILDREDFHAAYIIGEKLGNGNFGQVRSCLDLGGGKFAVKILDVRRRSPDKISKIARAMQRWDPETRELRKRALHEASIWQRVGSHLHCVRLIKVFMHERLCYFVMELAEKSVVKALEEMLPYPVEADLLRIIYEMLLALRHLSSLSIVHRDMKPDNFLLGGASGTVTKLCDYGLSSILPANGRLHGVVGTPPYMCPEMINGYAYSTRADMWSLGAAAYVMLYGKFPYEPEVRSTQNMKKVIGRGYPAPEYNQIQGYPQPSKLAERIVRALLVRCPSKREEAERALSSPLGQELEKTILNRDDTNLEKSASFLPVVRAAEMHIQEFRSPPADPTVQHSIDQILEFQRLYTPRARSFSDTLTAFDYCQAVSSLGASTGSSSSVVCQHIDSRGSTCSCLVSRLPSSDSQRDRIDSKLVRRVSCPIATMHSKAHVTSLPMTDKVWATTSTTMQVQVSSNVVFPKGDELDARTDEVDSTLPGANNSSKVEGACMNSIVPATSISSPTLLDRGRRGRTEPILGACSIETFLDSDPKGLHQSGILQ